ncbi:GNAT family N-acetyltransferase, partial [Candidatus Woesearchaeota archaeon]|nr:GNAT family N-acetyltransferase [Candidatus Woesearchaeota archaeon]
LPGVSRKKDLLSLQALFAFEEFRPDMLKIYPCMVLKGTRLYRMWKKKEYAPLTTKKAAGLIAEFKGMVPEYCRISRVQRDIPTFMTEAGVDRTNLRQYIHQLMGDKKTRCRCIRCRESGHMLGKDRKIKVRKISILERHYIASGGNEFFISAEDVKNDILFGFCRLRFPSSSLRKEITHDSALIRELHIYSPSVRIGERSSLSYQHRGLGKKLIKKAEETARTYYKKKMVVIAGVGARAYFAKLGYKKDGPYMSKHI